MENKKRHDFNKLAKVDREREERLAGLAKSEAILQETNAQLSWSRETGRRVNPFNIDQMNKEWDGYKAIHYPNGFGADSLPPKQPNEEQEIRVVLLVNVIG